jgi:hypothetical protein
MQTMSGEFQLWPQLKQSFFSNTEKEACGHLTMSFVLQHRLSMQLPFRWAGETVLVTRFQRDQTRNLANAVK